jgi:hypothetical protein
MRGRVFRRLRGGVDMSSDGRCPILVLGIGNILLRDEGVGVRVIERIREAALPEGVEVVDGGTAGADLLDYCRCGAG